MPTVSYVVTVYNKGHLLPPVPAALFGQQGDFSREFIFVDDGSTDGGAELITAATADWPQVRLHHGARQRCVAASHAHGRTA